MKMKWFGILGDNQGNLTNTGAELGTPNDNDFMVTYSAERDSVLILVYAVTENQALDISSSIYRTAKEVWGKNLTWKHEVV